MNNKVKRVLVAVVAIGAFTGVAAVTVAAMTQEHHPVVQPGGAGGSDLSGHGGSGAAGVGGARLSGQGGAGPSGEGS